MSVSPNPRSCRRTSSNAATSGASVSASRPTSTRSTTGGCSSTSTGPWLRADRRSRRGAGIGPRQDYSPSSRPLCRADMRACSVWATLRPWRRCSCYPRSTMRVLSDATCGVTRLPWRWPAGGVISGIRRNPSRSAARLRRTRSGRRRDPRRSRRIRAPDSRTRRVCRA